jgi:hypothetical protein
MLEFSSNETLGQSLNNSDFRTKSADFERRGVPINKGNILFVIRDITI